MLNFKLITDYIFWRQDSMIVILMSSVLVYYDFFSALGGA